MSPFEHIQNCTSRPLNKQNKNYKIKEHKNKTTYFFKPSIEFYKIYLNISIAENK